VTVVVFGRASTAVLGNRIQEEHKEILETINH
jgi:hypothetical protein